MAKQDDQFSKIVPLIAAGIIFILVLLIYTSYLKTANIKPYLSVPNGTTYLGK